MLTVGRLWHFARWLAARPWLGEPERVRVPSITEQLLRSPAFKALAHDRRRRLARERRAIADDTKGLVAEIRAAGYRIDSLHDLICQAPGPGRGLVKRRFKRRFVGPYRNAYPILARHLFVQHQPLVRKCLVSALAKPDVGEEIEAQLLRALSAEPDKDVRANMAQSLWAAMGPERAAAYPELEELTRPRGDRVSLKVPVARGGERTDTTGRVPVPEPPKPIGPAGTACRVALIVGRQSLYPVNVTPVGERLFRLEQNVFAVDWSEAGTDQKARPRYGDTIVARQVGRTTISYVSVHARGPYRHREYLARSDPSASHGLQSLFAQIRAEGGHVDVYMKNWVHVALPESSTFDPKSALDRAAGAAPGPAD